MILQDVNNFSNVGIGLDKFSDNLSDIKCSLNKNTRYLIIGVIAPEQEE
jgi:hypothetical protein